MYFHSSLLALLLGTPAAFAALNGHCSGVAGICLSTAKCGSVRGRSVSGKCPYDPPDVKCCQSIPCGERGHCTWPEECDHTFASRRPGLCPGPTSYQCCEPRF